MTALGPALRRADHCGLVNGIRVPGATLGAPLPLAFEHGERMRATVQRKRRTLRVPARWDWARRWAECGPGAELFGIRGNAPLDAVQATNGSGTAQPVGTSEAPSRGAIPNPYGRGVFALSLPRRAFQQVRSLTRLGAGRGPAATARLSNCTQLNAV